MKAIIRFAALGFAVVIFALVAFQVIATHVVQWAAGAQAAFVGAFLLDTVKG